MQHRYKIHCAKISILTAKSSPSIHSFLKLPCEEQRITWLHSYILGIPVSTELLHKSMQ